MAYEFGYDGLRNAGTFKLDTTTANKIKADPKQIIGKVVTLVGNYEVGYGADKAVPLGVVESVEPYVSGSTTMVVTVAWGQTFEDVPCTSGDTFGKYLFCDGNGGLKKAAGAEVSNCKALGVSGTLATIKID